MKTALAILIINALGSFAVIAFSASFILAFAILALCACTAILLAWTLAFALQTASQPHAGDVDDVGDVP